MPLENYDEELETLRTEITQCRQRRYALACVAIGCNDPQKYGLSTVRIDRATEVKKVVDHLDRVLLDLEQGKVA